MAIITNRIVIIIFLLIFACCVEEHNSSWNLMFDIYSSEMKGVKVGNLYYNYKLLHENNWAMLKTKNYMNLEDSLVIHMTDSGINFINSHGVEKALYSYSFNEIYNTDNKTFIYKPRYTKLLAIKNYIYKNREYKICKFIQSGDSPHSIYYSFYLVDFGFVEYVRSDGYGNYKLREYKFSNPERDSIFKYVYAEFSSDKSNFKKL